MRNVLDFRETCLLLGAVIGFTMFTGCGDGRPERVPVSGTVLVDGEPLKTEGQGFVRVEPADGRAAIGKIDGDTGRFTLTTYEKGDGVILGTHPVVVIVHATRGTQTISLIPEKYNSAKTSGLTVTVEEPTDSLQIELEGPLKEVPAKTSAPSEGEGVDYGG